MSERTKIGRHMYATTPLGTNRIWEIYSQRGDHYLGYVAWYEEWHQYVFYPHPETLHSAGCLKALVEFMESPT